MVGFDDWSRKYYFVWMRVWISNAKILVIKVSI